MSNPCCLVCLLMSLHAVSISHAGGRDDMVRVPAGSFMMGYVSEWIKA